MKPIILVGEAYSDSDFRSQSAFSGSTGIELFRMLNESGLLTATSLDRELINKFYSTQDPTIPKLFQNRLFDIAFLLKSMGIGVRGATHDSMLEHHALQPESLKGLAFLGSLYTDHGPWKSERKKTDTIKRDE